MSTTTAKLGLIKPELTDPADITATNQNWDKIDDALLNANGDTMRGSLNFKKVENGHTTVSKNHNDTDDYGFYVTDYDANGNVVRFIVSAKENAVLFRDTSDNKSYKLYSQYNKDTLTTDIAHHLRLYTDLSQIGLSVGSETIESIATKLPNYSRLTMTVAAENNVDIFPNGNYGLLVVEKTVNSRVLFTFTNNKGTQWTGVYSIAADGNVWTDWQMEYSASEKMILTQYLHYGNTLPDAGTPGRLFLKKV